jgi:hypothetical protein
VGALGGVALALCSKLYNNNKRLGRDIARGRALDALRSADDASQVHP